MLKKLSTLWRFLLPVLILLIIAAFGLTWQQTNQQLVTIEENAKQQAGALSRLLNVTDVLVSEQADTAMQLLQNRSYTLGQPGIRGTGEIGGKSLPNLVFGETAQANTFELVDTISKDLGGTATLFVKHGEGFYRISTNVRKPDGSRAVGTQLDPAGKAIAAIKEGKMFRGMVDILGTPYITRYDPMLDSMGNIIGAWYIGYKVDMQVIREAVENAHYLQTGFVSVQDEYGNIRFSSKHLGTEFVSDIINNRPSSWMLVEEYVEKWGFKITVAYPLSEAYLVGWANSLFVISESTLLGVLLIIIILWQLRRLVLDPIGGDPALAIEVVQKIASGNLNRDGLKAKPGTLMANVLSMRRKLRDMVNALQENADRMRLSASVFGHAHDGIFITDADSRIVEINPAFTQISGYSREDAIGRTPAELNFACNEPNFFDYLWQNTASAGDWKGETENRRNNGDVYVASLDLFVVRNEETREVSHYVGVFSDITSDMAHRENLEHMAYHDPLTQLPNRTLLSDRLQQALAHAMRTGELLAICYFDLDDFKEVNDALGHEAGDQLLVEFSHRMRSCLRETDTIARMGGDEFAMLLCGLDSIDECEMALNRLLVVINSPFSIDGHIANVSASIGYTLFPYDNSTADTLLRHADHAMYQAKINGGRSHHLFDAEHDRFTRGQRQERERIEAALANNELCLYYQPKVDMQRGQVVSMEALIRWQHPELGLRSPNDFLPQIEHTDFVISLGEWVILEALRQMSYWQRAGLHIPVSVNIAARHLMQSNFAVRLAELLNLYPEVSPSKLELEITETAVIEDISGVTQIMHSCRMLGITFALDDFGVGYSSLTYLRRLPIDIIKIDQSFVRDMLHDSDDLALIAGVISLSREFGRSVIAEGVESAEHGVQLLRMGCNLAQGYGIARPMPADQVEDWIKSYEPDKNWKQTSWQLSN
ncbi:putative signaling protein [Methylophilaceae bacterium]|nr:putative signaling protein [Methylophilaceae bacterium]